MSNELASYSFKITSKWPPLAFNAVDYSLEMGEVSSWEKSNVVPMFKNDNRTNSGN